MSCHASLDIDSARHAGKPAASQPFDRGGFRQPMEVPDVWLERAHLRADDILLMGRSLGLVWQALRDHFWHIDATLLRIWSM